MGANATELEGETDRFVLIYSVSCGCRGGERGLTSQRRGPPFPFSDKMETRGRVNRGFPLR